MMMMMMTATILAVSACFSRDCNATLGPLCEARKECELSSHFLAKGCRSSGSELWEFGGFQNSRLLSEHLA